MEKAYTFNASKFLDVVGYIMAVALPLAIAKFILGDRGKIGTILVILLLYCLTPAKYVPVLSTLVIDEQSVKKTIGGLATRTIQRSSLYVGSIYFVDTRFLIFSKVPLSHASRRRIKWLVLSRKAFLFPEKQEMYRDFPEIFSNVARIIY